MCCAAVCCVVLLYFVSAIFAVSPQTVCYSISSPPPCYIRFLCLCDGDQHATLHGHVLGGNGAMPKMDGTSTSGGNVTSTVV